MARARSEESSIDAGATSKGATKRKPPPATPQPATFGRVIIEAVRPEVDGGRAPIKRVCGDWIEVEADIFSDGHEVVTAEILFRALEERLERGEVIHYPVCPFPLAEGNDRQFLLEQRLSSKAHKNISYDPKTEKAAGYLVRSAEQAERLRSLLASFAESATSWLAETLPHLPI